MFRRVGFIALLVGQTVSRYRILESLGSVGLSRGEDWIRLVDFVRHTPPPYWQAGPASFKNDPLSENHPLTPMEGAP